MLHVLRGHRSAVRSLVCLSPSSAFAPPCLMSGSYDRTIKLWELTEGECQCVGSLGTRGSVWTMALSLSLTLTLTLTLSLSLSLSLSLRA